MTARRLSLVSGVLAAVACASVLPKSAKSELFVLTSLDPTASPAASAAPSILLGRVTLPEYLDRRELVTRLDSNQLRIEDLELWAEPLRDSVPRTIERDLGALLGEGKVQRLPWLPATPPSVVLAVEVRRFEATSHGTVELAAGWTIADGQGNARLRRDAHVALPVAAPGAQAAVRALSDALAALCRQIAPALVQAGPGAPPPSP